MNSRLWTGFALSALAAARLSAGVVYEIEVTDHDQSPPRVSTTTIEVEGPHLKMGIPPRKAGSAGGEAIWRGDRREMVVVDHDTQSFTVMDEKTMAALAGQVSGIMGQMEEALKNVPADRRAAVEEMMRQRMPQQAPKQPVAELERTDERATMNGYPCVKYIVRVAGREERELWVTDWDSVEGGDDVIAVFHDLSEFFRGMAESLEQAAGGLSGGMGGGIGDGYIPQLSELDGFPVVSRELGIDGSLEGESVLRSASRRKLDPEDFEPPAGYKRRSMTGQ